MKTIDTLGTILTYNFGIIILFFTWFLVARRAPTPKQQTPRATTAHTPQRSSSAPGGPATDTCKLALDRSAWALSLVRTTTRSSTHSAGAGTSSSFRSCRRTWRSPSSASAWRSSPTQARLRDEGASGGPRRRPPYPCLPAPYSLLTPSVAARRAAVGRGALGWAGLGWDERMWEQCIQASRVAWAWAPGAQGQGWPWHAR